MKTGGVCMNLINEKAIEEFVVWAKQNEDKNIFPQISQEESYYTDRTSEETYMMEYSFRTMEELKCALEKYSGLKDDPQILKAMTIEICKNRFRCNLNTQEQKDNRYEKVEVNNSEKTLPDYVYAF